ncbi:hypothetical protein [Paenibacillus hexagrammi]|uniref:Uncharacterized protein n=1 Tax=Paenibacillus hexagrammi TaxID=2908839 RepID=A0ABY3SKS1_9BACL|nr:hypothetical protein [Paenibacillus sp. YPD9-1]UJF33582.1 hypothetical protein L0M14_29510 [Paenibacillus sp. YPD9-1]
MEKTAEYTQCYEASKLRTAVLEKQLKQAEAEYAAMQAKREELMRRSQKMESHAASRSCSSSNAFPGLETGSALRGFQRIEDMIKHKEAQFELEQSMKAEAAAAREALVLEQLTRLRSNAKQG